MNTTRALLIGMGVEPERIRQESFGSADPESAPQHCVPSETSAIIEFARSGGAYAVRSSQTLLEAAEQHGIYIPSACRQGQCGTCKTKLLAGDVRMESEVGLDPDSRAQGFVLTCVGYAEGPVKLDA